MCVCVREGGGGVGGVERKSERGERVGENECVLEVPFAASLKFKS